MSEENNNLPAKKSKKDWRKENLYNRSEDTPLSIMEEKFCYALMKCGNGPQAALEAGSKAKPSSLKMIAYLILQRPNVAAFIKKLKKERAEKSMVDAYYVLEGLKEVAHRCLQKIPVQEWNGEEWVNTGEYKFDSAGANKAFELIGKHIGFFDQDNNQKKALIQINIDADDQGL